MYTRHSCTEIEYTKTLHYHTEELKCIKKLIQVPEDYTLDKVVTKLNFHLLKKKDA